MGQYKFYINYNFTQFVVGIKYNKRESLAVFLIFFTFVIGLTKTAKGFGIEKG